MQSKDPIPSIRPVEEFLPAFGRIGRTPFQARLTTRGYGVLRLRGCFASRNTHSAPDDKLKKLTPLPVLRFRPPAASFRERAPLLRMPPGLPPAPWLQPLPFLTTDARCRTTPSRFP